MTSRERNSTESKLGRSEANQDRKRCRKLSLQEINPSALGLGLTLSLGFLSPAIINRCEAVTAQLHGCQMLLTENSVNGIPSHLGFSS